MTMLPAPQAGLPQSTVVRNLYLTHAPPVNTFFFNADLNVSVPTNGNSTFQIGQFTMPYYGDMVYQGSMGLYTDRAGVQAPVVQMSMLSVPAPSFNPGNGWRTEGGAGHTIVHVPVYAKWVGVGVGTVTLLANLANGSGAPTIVAYKTSGIIMCMKT